MKETIIMIAAYVLYEFVKDIFSDDYEPPEPPKRRRKRKKKKK